MGHTANVLTGQPVRGFESLPLRQSGFPALASSTPQPRFAWHRTVCPLRIHFEPSFLQKYGRSDVLSSSSSILASRASLTKVFMDSSRLSLPFCISLISESRASLWLTSVFFFRVYSSESRSPSIRKSRRRSSFALIASFSLSRSVMAA